MNSGPQPVVVATVSLLLLALMSAGLQGDFDRGPDGTEVPPTLTTRPGPPPVATSVPPTTLPPVTAPVSTVVATMPVPPVEQLTSGEIEAILAGAGFPNLEVEIDGLAVTVSGSVPDDVTRRAVISQVAAIPNVDRVIDHLTI